DDAAFRLKELKRIQSDKTGNVETAAIVSLEARLLAAQGRTDDAVAAISQFAEQQIQDLDDQLAPDAAKKAKAQVYLTVGNLLTAIGEHQEAGEWYRRLADTVPQTYVLLVRSLMTQGRVDEAVEVCLAQSDGPPAPDVAARLAGLLTSAQDPPQDLDRVRSIVESVLEGNPEHINLLLAVAAMRVGEEDEQQAIELFRRVVKLSPDHSMALNNLATMLADQPDARDEALATIEHALKVTGRRPALLDTQGTILLKSGDAAQAVACLEEATAGGTADPRYYFHLAAAYAGANRPDDARDALATSRDQGLEQALLTDSDRKLIIQLQRELEQSGEEK
ncbi:tetratricopeptide repeat protein, partial [Pirellulales bacterium]|nr:tetratricopeptide repeat protein [Pirellulales bacterium]